MAQDAQAEPEADASAATAPEGSRSHLLYAPVPFSSPSSGTGLAAGAVLLYNPNGGPNQWITGGGVILTSRGTRGIAAFHSMSSASDRFRLEARLSLMDEENNYYGTGAAGGDRDDPLVLDDKTFGIKVKALFQVFANTYAGVRYVLATHDAEPDDEQEGDSLTPPPPADQRDSTMSVLGPSLAYDTRDNHSQPRTGVQVNATWLFGRDVFGDSFKHDKLAVVGSAYTPLAERTVLAGKASFCSAGGEVPYYDLCLFGQGGDLRGYPSGRYRDRASWAVQGELRHGFSTRWGGVLFAGIGGISPTADDLFDNTNFLPAGGLGVRYRPFKDNKVQLRLDLAVGEDTRGVYLGIGEAF